ncbi:hypothetical protein S40293_01456 [Stachybotrys chartarum IBT 40293]|nr:hypothetical protein S40293_01456 [Stachybotrys chartarum IBT 40293]
MPGVETSCCLCGGSVINQFAEPSWMAQFYVVYAVSEEADSPTFLSGPGRREQLADHVNSASSAHITDESESFAIDLMRLTFGAPSILPSLIERAPQAWGFPVHSACWNILLRSFRIGPLHIRALFSLCRSFPAPQGLIDFGHDYGGLFHREATSAPAEEPELVLPPGSTMQNFNPFDIPELRRVFKQATVPSESLTDLPPPQAAGTTNVDVFASLPPEILLLILNCLPSADVVHVKQASRTYAELALPDSFWKSRFFPGQEFQDLFEVEEYVLSHKGHWRLIFNSVKALRNRPAMLNRRRVWALCSSLYRVLEAMGSTRCGGSAVQSFWEPGAPPDERLWVTASRALKPPRKYFDTGSRAIYERTLLLPPRTVAVFGSLFDLFGRRYISGIRVLDDSGKSFSLGYRHTAQEKLLSQGQGPLRIAGFCLAYDQKGVRGLAVISDAGVMSDWLGDYDGIPKRRLVLGAEGSDLIECLKGGFDLVSLGVGSVCEAEKKPVTPLSFRDTTLWYPEIPHPNFSFLGVSENLHLSDQNQELPLCFDVFGGDNGERIENFSTISFETKEVGAMIYEIVGFHTNMSHVARLVIQGVQGKRRHDLEIDGPGGERITGLDTFHIYTSRDRIITVLPMPTDEFPPHRMEVRSVRVGEGTVVGFWAMMWHRGFTDIGLVAVKSPTA